MLLHRHDGDVLEIALVGDLDADDGAAFAGWLARELPSCERATLFLDFEAIRSYATPVRSEATRVLLEHRGRWTEVHTLGGTTLVRMGVSVANIALGGAVHPHASRETFEARLALARAG